MILLRAADPFPPTESARQDMGGLLAIGADLSPARLLNAYRQGIFPWGTLDGLPLWFFPSPRTVLFPDRLRITRSLHKTLRRGDYVIRLDEHFPEVIAACASMPRSGQDGTWILPDMQRAYIRMHELGWAHSVEVWQEGRLTGGLYGLAIGGVFFGESMFSRQSNASKIALAHLVRYLAERSYGLIDCQMHTDHLASLGAVEIGGEAFSAHLHRLAANAENSGRWSSDDAFYEWSRDVESQ